MIITPLSPKATLRRIRQRFHRLHPLQRPRLDQPENAVGLLGLADCIALAESGRWPLDADLQTWLATPPRKRKRRRRRRLQLEDLLDLAETERGRLRDLLWSILRRKDS
jgi:hypothetical protein